MIVDRRQWILDRCAVGERIIDIGSANGWVLNNTPFRKYTTSVDIDKYEYEGFIQADAHNLSIFKDKEFDIAILGEILEHVKDPIKVMNEAKRITKRILMTIPNETEWDEKLYPFETIGQGMKRRNLTLEEIAKLSNPNVKEFYTKDDYGHLFHCRYYTQSTLERDLEFSGIKDYKLEILRYGNPQWSFFAIDANCNNTNNKNLDISPTLPFKPDDKIIEFGGGSNPFVRPNYDIRQLPNVDHIIDLNDPNLPISSDHCDGIYSRYLIEHINWRNVKRFLTETYRILKPNGNIVLITANLLEQAKVLVNAQQWDNDLIGMIFGAEDYKENTHQCGFSPQYVTKILTDIGFEDITITPINSDFGPTDMEIRAVKPYKPENRLQTKTGPIITQGPIVLKEELKTLKNISDKNLRIALISTPFFTVPPKGYSGLEQVVWDLAEALDELGHDVTLFAPEGSQPTKHGHLVVTGPSINTVCVNWLEEEKKAYEKYKDIITPEKFDIIIDHTWFAFIYLMKMNNPKLKILHQHHGGYSWDSLPPIGNGKPNLMAISKFMKEYTIQYFRGKGYDIGCEYIHNGIDLDKYLFQPYKTDRLLFVGRLSIFKQPDWAIEVAKRTGYKLDIIGSSNFVDSVEYVKRLEKIIQDDHNIALYANASHELKIEKMQNAKAILVPSKMNEPLNLVSIEGQACGTPIICTRDGGLPETVIDGKTGIVCNDIQEMIDAIGNIHKIKSEDCRKNIEENFSRLKMAKGYENLACRLLREEEW